MTHEEYVELQRSRVVHLAENILNGTMDVLEGAHAIAGLRWELEAPEEDPDLDLFVGIESETDSLPIGSQRQDWAIEALALREPEIEKARAWARGICEEACRNLVTRFGHRNVHCFGG